MSVWRKLLRKIYLPQLTTQPQHFRLPTARDSYRQGNLSNLQRCLIHFKLTWVILRPLGSTFEVIHSGIDPPTTSSTTIGEVHCDRLLSQLARIPVEGPL